MLMIVAKVRLDRLLVERGLIDSRERARRLIMAGDVRIGDRIADKPGQLVAPDAEITLQQRLAYVSRGGLKLAAALQAFAVPLKGAVCVDVGASTGGFTDVLLQNDAAHVIAIDVGYGQLDWKLRNDPRVTVLERTNARTLQELPIDPNSGAPYRPRVATVDASFISVTLLLPAVAQWLADDAHAIVLIKPQFEAGRERVGRGGVVRDAQVHRDVLTSVLGWAQDHDWVVRGLIQSPITGPAGNIEFLCWLMTGISSVAPFDIVQAIDHLIPG